MNVTLNLSAFFVNSVKNDCKKPDLSIIPIPISVMISILRGANEAKFATVELNIVFNPDRLNNDLTAAVVLSILPLIAFITL